MTDLETVYKVREVKHSSQEEVWHMYAYTVPNLNIILPNIKTNNIYDHQPVVGIWRLELHLVDMQEGVHNQQLE